MQKLRVAEIVLSITAHHCTMVKYLDDLFINFRFNVIVLYKGVVNYKLMTIFPPVCPYFVQYVYQILTNLLEVKTKNFLSKPKNFWTKHFCLIPMLGGKYELESRLMTVHWNRKLQLNTFLETMICPMAILLLKDITHSLKALLQVGPFFARGLLTN